MTIGSTNNCDHKPSKDGQPKATKMNVQRGRSHETRASRMPHMLVRSRGTSEGASTVDVCACVHACVCSHVALAAVACRMHGFSGRHLKLRFRCCSVYSCLVAQVLG